MILVLLQARLDSTRLPRKALLPLLGKPMVRVVMERLRRVRADAYVLATDEEAQQTFAPLAEEEGFSLFAGPKEDVLARFCRAIETYGPRVVVRATGDNPLVSWELANEILSQHIDLQADYSAFQGMPLGLGVEVVNPDCLLLAEKESKDPYDHEHVTPYLYRNPQRFYLHRPLAPLCYRGRNRVTVDTEEDYRKVIKVYSRLRGMDLPSTGDVLAVLREMEGGEAA